MENNYRGFVDFLATECPLELSPLTGKVGVFMSFDNLIACADRYAKLCKDRDYTEKLARLPK